MSKETRETVAVVVVVLLLLKVVCGCVCSVLGEGGGLGRTDDANTRQARDSAPRGVG